MSGRRIDYPRPPLMNLPAYVGMVLPSVEAERPDAAPAIPRVIVQTWREEVRVARAMTSLTRAARRTDHSCCDVQLARAQPRVRRARCPGANFADSAPGPSSAGLTARSDYLYFNDVAAARYVDQWKPSTKPAVSSNYSVPAVRPRADRRSPDQSYAQDEAAAAFFGPCTAAVKPRASAEVLLNKSEIKRIKAAYHKCAATSSVRADVARLTNTASRADVFRAMILCASRRHCATLTAQMTWAGSTPMSTPVRLV